MNTDNPVDKWTPARTEYLLQMWQAGKTPFEIATTLGGVKIEDVILKGEEFELVPPAVVPDNVMDVLIDDLVKQIDYDAWKLGYNEETAEEPEFVEGNRNALKAIIFSHGV